MGGLSTLSTPYLGRSHARFNHNRSICSIHSQLLGLKEGGQVCAPFPVLSSQVLESRNPDPRGRTRGHQPAPTALALTDGGHTPAP